MAVSAPTPLAAAATTANATSLTATASAGVAAGSFVLVSVGGGGASQTLGVTDSLGNTYTALTAAGIASGSASTIQFFYCFTTAAVVSGTTTFTATKATTGGISLTVDAYTGVDTGTPINGAQVTGSSTANTTTAATPTSSLTVAAGGAVIELGISNYNRTFAAGAGYTIAHAIAGSGTGNPRSISTEYQLFASASTVTPVITLDAPNPWGVAAIALNAGSTSGTGGSAATATASAVGAGRRVIAHPTVALIGDSLTERQVDHAAPPTRQADTTAAWLSAGLMPDATSFYWYGKGGKAMTGADANGTTVAQNVTAARAALGQVDKWVIALGTNDTPEADATFQANVTATLNLIYPIGSETDQVYWVSLTAQNAGNSTYTHANPLIQAAIAAHPNAAQIHYLDFATYIHSAGVYDAADWLTSDVPHMTQQGYGKRDSYIASAMLGTIHSGGSTATASSSAAGAGLKRGLGGSSATGTSAATGAGYKRATGGAVASVTATAVGAGQKVTPGAGGSVALGTANATGAGYKIAAGGAVAGVAAIALGAGFERASGGSIATATASAAGAGRNPTASARVLHLTATLAGEQISATLTQPRLTASIERT